MQCTQDGDTPHHYQFDMSATSRLAANQAMDQLIPRLTQLVTAWNHPQPGLQFRVNITRLHKTPSLAKIRLLAGTLRVLRPHLVKSLRQTTIHVQTRMQQALLRLVFRLQPPATPIRVVRCAAEPHHAPCPESPDSIADTLEMEAEANKHPVHALGLGGPLDKPLPGLQQRQHKTLARC